MGWFSSLIGGAVGFLIGGPVGAVIGAGIGATKVGEKVVNTVLDFVLQPFMPNMPDIGDAGGEAQRQQGVLIQRQGSVEQIPVVYGYRKVGGVVSFAETGSTNNKYLYVAYVFCEGLVEGLREVYIDDWLLPTDQVGQLNGGQLVTVNADRYKDRVQLRWYPGVYFSNPRSSTVGSTVKGDIFSGAPTFTSDMVYNGMAVLFARYEWKEIKTQADADANPFSGNIPEVKVALLGKRVASLTVDSTETSTYDSNTVRYSTNPAECLLDYLRNPRYGKGLTNSDIDWTSWKQAARKCNQTVTYVASGISGPILTLNEVVSTNATIMSNVKSMLQNFRAYMPYVQGKYKLRIEDAGNDTDILSGAATIVQTFTKDDIVSDVTYTGIDKSSKYNVVAVTYVDPDQKFSNQTVVYPETESERQIYIDRDGGRENKYEVTLGGLTNYAIAKDMARLIFNKQRRQESCVFTATSKALELEPGDCIRIQSNILNFGTDPWRVVSIKINNNMTVDLGCVRNPDDIYPYVRVGEEDIVLPTYVPKGSIIYFPSSTNTPPLGLVPPLYAVFPPSTTPITPLPTNPAPTNPDAPGGGGVGGPGPITAPPTTPVPPTNVTPVDPPKPAPFAAVLTLQKTVYTKSDENSGIFTLTFSQPSEALYDHSLFWWRINQFSNWNEQKLDAKPGAGGAITVSLGPLPRLGRTYEYYIRSYATDGRPSNQVVYGQFFAVENQSKAGEFIGTGSAGPRTAEGWSLPASSAPTAPWYDDEISEIAIKPKLVGGVPQATRRMSVTMTQLLYTSNTKVNPLIDGIYVYYKYKDDTYWLREELPMPAGYYAGQQVNWDLAGDFGARIYPVTGVEAIYSATIFQLYDFVIRLRYKDGTTAKKQMVASKAPVEINGLGLYDYIAVGTSPYSSVGVSSKDIPVGFEIPLLSQQDPATIYNTAQDLLPNFYRIRASSQESKIQFQFNPPTNSKFRGYRIRYRPVLAGADPDFVTVEVGKTPAIDGKIYFELAGDYRHSTKYEWMITVKHSAGEVDATNCFYTRALIPFGVPSGTELLNNYFNFETKDTKATLGEISAAFPAVAAIIPQKWIKKQLVKYSFSDSRFVGTNSAGGSGAMRLDAANQLRLNMWYQLQFQAPNQTFNNLVIYRRVFSSAGANRTTIGQVAKYNLLGPWERVSVPRTSLTHLGSGVYTVDVRGPIRPDVFEPYYQVSAGQTLYNRSYGPPPSKYDVGAPQYLENVYPYYGLGNDTSSGVYKAEFIFVLDDGGEGAKGARVTEFNTDIDGAANNFKTEVDGIQSANIPRDDYVTISDFNGFTPGYVRNINEALSGIPTAALASEQWGRDYPRINSSYTQFLNNYFPANPTGVTVY